MPWLNELRRRLAALFRRNQIEADLDEEMRLHLELRAQQQKESGIDAGEARYIAQRQFGNVLQLKEAGREVWGWRWLETVMQDIRYGTRVLRRNPGFAMAAVLSLALGIGANTAIFSLIDALLLRSLPVRDPGELVQLLLVEQGRTGDSFGYPTVQALAKRADLLVNLCGFAPASFNVSFSDAAERVAGAWVTGAYYPTLGLDAYAGRLLTPADDQPGAPPVAVLAYGYWAGRFARDFSVIGRPIQIEGKPVTIVGISPPGFTGANVGVAANVTLPLAVLPQVFPERPRMLQSGAQWLRVLARPQPGLSIKQLRARLNVVWPQMASVALTPQMNAKRRDVLLHSSISLIPGGTGYSWLRQSFRKPLLTLLAITGLLLLVACANFASLLLARGAARSREIAVRFAIGAGRWRIIRQLLTETVMLALGGGLLAIGLAFFGSRSLVALLSSGRRDVLFFDLRPDARMLLFTGAIALAAGIVFGLVPALGATASGPGAALKADSVGALRTRFRLLPTLVVSQVGLTLVLLIGAGLFVRTLQNLQQLDPGFHSEGVLLVDIDARRGYKDDRLAALHRELLAEFEHLPGVVSAGLSSNTPLSGGIWSDPVSINGRPPKSEDVHINLVTPRYFETLGTPLLLGRDFSEIDHSGAPGAAIVNETFVRRFLEGHPLGQTVAIPDPHYGSFQIVGVVKDTLSWSLREEAPPAIYLPCFQYPEKIGYAFFELRAEGSLTGISKLVRDELRAKFSATAADVQIEPLTQQVRRTLIQEQMLAALGTCFGALALTLAAVGLYGLLAYTVTRSTHEIGVRLALGATRSDVLGRVLSNALRLSGLGIALGLPVAWACSHLIASMLFGLSATDPVTILGAALLLALTALVAAFVPARRASRIDPMVALRYE